VSFIRLKTSHRGSEGLPGGRYRALRPTSDAKPAQVALAWLISLPRTVAIPGNLAMEFRGATLGHGNGSFAGVNDQTSSEWTPDKPRCIEPATVQCRPRTNWLDASL